MSSGPVSSSLPDLCHCLCCTSVVIPVVPPGPVSLLLSSLPDMCYHPCWTCVIIIPAGPVLLAMPDCFRSMYLLDHCHRHYRTCVSNPVVPARPKSLSLTYSTCQTCVIVPTRPVLYFFSDLCHCRCRTLRRRPCRPCRTFFIPAGPVSSLLPDLSCRPAMIFDFVPAGPVSAPPLSLPDLFCRPCHTVPVEPVSSPPDLCNCPC